MKLSLKDFVQKYVFEKKNTTSKIKLQQVMKKVGLDSKVRISLRVGSFLANSDILNLHPCKRTHWLGYIDDCYFDSYGCHPKKNFLFTKKTGKEKVFIQIIKITKKLVFLVVRFYI